MNPDITKLLKSGFSVPLRHCLVDLTGDPQKAMVLTQMIYWAERASRQDGWFWKSAQELEDDLKGLWSRRTITTVLKQLAQDGWLSRQPGNNPMKRAYWYQVNEAKLLDGLRNWTARQAETEKGENGQTVGDYGQHVGDNGQYIREPQSKITDSESNPTPYGVGAEDRKTAVEGAPSSLTAAIQEVDLALRQAYQIVRGQLWDRLKEDIANGRQLEHLFGPFFELKWSKKEQAYLNEMLTFCAEQWPDQDSAQVVGALVRGSFALTGKPFQILKYWINSNACKPTLRPYLTLAGGGKDRLVRLDFLKELAANPRVQQFVMAVPRVEESPAQVPT